jgi:predicted solute-binding protein
MELLNEDHLKAFGFIEKTHMSNNIIIKVMSFDNINLVIKHDGIYYSNMGFDYPLKDIDSLKKLYKELKRKELKAVY